MEVQLAPRPRDRFAARFVSNQFSRPESPKSLGSSFTPWVWGFGFSAPLVRYVQRHWRGAGRSGPRSRCCAVKVKESVEEVQSFAALSEAEAPIESVPKTTKLPKESARSSLWGFGNPNFVSRAKHAPWGPLPYAIDCEEFLEFPPVELTMVICVLASSFIVAVGTLPFLAEPGFEDVRAVLDGLENSICIVFVIEFVLRWYSRSLRPTYILKPLVIIDIISFLPILISIADFPSAAAVVAGFRLLRIFRLQRFLSNYDGFLILAQGMGIDKSYVTPVQLEVTRVVLSIFSLLYIATGAIYAAEHDVNPQFPDFFTALYFGLTTLTTVGFGDITPITVQGRFVVAFSILAGVAVFPYQFSRLAEVFMLQRDKPKAEEVKGRICSNCQASPHRSDATFCWRCGSVMPATD